MSRIKAIELELIELRNCQDMNRTDSLTSKLEHRNYRRIDGIGQIIFNRRIKLNIELKELKRIENDRKRQANTA